MVKRKLLHKRILLHDGGSGLVELALVLPLLCLVLVGSFEIGRLAYASIEVSNAARAAVAYGAQNGVTAQDELGVMGTAAAADAANLTAMGATLRTTTSNPCYCDTGSAMVSYSDCTTIKLTCCPSCSNAGTIVNYVQADTTATVNTIFHYPGIPSSYTLHGFAKMRVLQ